MNDVGKGLFITIVGGITVVIIASALGLGTPAPPPSATPPATSLITPQNSLDETSPSFLLGSDCEAGPVRIIPPGDPSSFDLKIGTFGSEQCKTLIVYNGQANWFEGIRDGVRYRPSETNFFGVPTSWGPNEMLIFLNEQGETLDSVEPY